MSIFLIIIIYNFFFKFLLCFRLSSNCNTFLIILILKPSFPLKWFYIVFSQQKNTIHFWMIFVSICSISSNRYVIGGQGWIRTIVRSRGQIYSLVPLTTRPPTHIFVHIKNPAFHSRMYKSGAPSRIRTLDPPVMSRLLWPTELRAHFLTQVKV